MTNLTYQQAQNHIEELARNADARRQASEAARGRPDRFASRSAMQPFRARGLGRLSRVVRPSSSPSRISAA